MKRERICLIIALIVAFVFTGVLLKERRNLISVREELAQEALAEEVLRFHVLANSDKEEDQRVKLKVKEEVLTYMKKHLPKGADRMTTRNWVRENLTKIESVAVETLQAEDCPSNVTAKLERVMFPQKTYGDITFPAGEYEALRIEIGEAKGQNWWCCLYPNLCFISSVHAVVPEEGKQELQSVLDEDSYEMITANTDYKIKWFFLGE